MNPYLEENNLGGYIRNCPGSEEWSEEIRADHLSCLVEEVDRP